MIPSRNEHVVMLTSVIFVDVLPRILTHAQYPVAARSRFHTPKVMHERNRGGIRRVGTMSTYNSESSV